MPPPPLLRPGSKRHEMVKPSPEGANWVSGRGVGMQEHQLAPGRWDSSRPGPDRQPGLAVGPIGLRAQGCPSSTLTSLQVTRRGWRALAPFLGKGPSLQSRSSDLVPPRPGGVRLPSRVGQWGLLQAGPSANRPTSSQGPLAPQTPSPRQSPSQHPLWQGLNCLVPG